MRLSIPAALTALLTATSALKIPRQDPSPDPGPSEDDVTSTIFVTDRHDRTVSSDTTVFRTVFSTIVVTVTDISTSVTTVSDVDTATSTVYVTSTQVAKRHIDVPAPAEATPVLEVPVKTVERVQTPPHITAAVPEYDRRLGAYELMRRAGMQDQLKRALAKRETIFVTVTVAVDGITTVFNSITSTVVSTTTSELHSTSIITSTAYENAKETVTVTSTIIIKATTVTTGPAETVGSVPDGSNIGDGDNSGGDSGSSGNNNNNDSKETGGGLSTGAKIGIGVGAGIAGLLLIGAIGTYFWKQHQMKPRVVDDGLGAGMSEVPVGGAGVGGAGVAAAAAANRHSRTPDHHNHKVSPLSPGFVPPASVTPEPRAGVAELGNQPVHHGAELSGEDALPRFPTAAEADSRPVMGHGSGPVPDVYEMPAEPYR